MRSITPEGHAMITCYLRYIIDPFKLAEFEHYAKVWIPLVEAHRDFKRPVGSPTDACVSDRCRPGRLGTGICTVVLS